MKTTYDQLPHRLLHLLTMGSLAALLCIGTPAISQAAPEKQSHGVSLQPDPQDASIARMAARLLEHGHYLRQPLNDTLSSRFLDRYLNLLDPQHLHFLQTDLAEFERYRQQLDDLTIKDGDTSPAYEIANRYIERLRQRVDFVTELLAGEPFDFTSNERITLNRREAPHPATLEDAKALWRERLKFELLQERLNKEKPEEIAGKIQRRYERLWRTFAEWDNGDVLQAYLTSLAHVYDPHSDYLGRSELQNFAIGMNLSLFGIGAVLTSEDGYCKIRELVSEGPAARSKKLKPGDRIIAVAQGDAEPVDIVEMKLSKAVELIRGPKGSEVRLTIIPADAPDPSVRRSVTLIRDEIKLEDQEAKASLIEFPTQDGRKKRIGVIDLPSFYATFDIPSGNGKPTPKSTTTDVARLLNKLKQENVQGIILDLRRNGGGSLEEAINLTGLFIKDGPVVQVQDPYGYVIVNSDTDPSVVYDGPLVVLTSRFSASASEIVAGALQDYDRAIVVGDVSTHGKGTVQTLHQLADYMRQAGIPAAQDPGALKTTIRKFYRANGSSTQLKGVTPDIVLPSVNNLAEVGEASLDNPLPWDTISKARYRKLDLVTPHIETLRKRSTNRVAASQDFAYVREDMREFEKNLADKTVSLNEEFRRKEKTEAEARKKAREEERRLRNEPEYTVYELPLKLADKPGLPEPKTHALAAAKTSTVNAENNAQDVPVANVHQADDGEGRDGDEDEDKGPSVDVALEEAKRILLDYIGLVPREAIAKVSR